MGTNINRNKSFAMPNEHILKYLVIEDSLKVCEGIKERMNKFENWNACKFAHHIDDAIKITLQEKPQLIFIDWALKGGSAFDVLENIHNISQYQPYIIFNTGYQSENPEIPQEIINNYKIDKYIVKPIWENLRKNISIYLEEAENKLLQKFSNKEIFLTDIDKKKVHVNLSKLICVCQQFNNPYNKVLYFTENNKITCKISWLYIIDFLMDKKIDFFITNSKQHLVVKNFIEYYNRPFIKLKGFPNKIEVVKDKLHKFEMWL